MQQFVREGIVESDTLEFADLGNGFLLLEGRIWCLGGAYIDVWKLLKIVDGEGRTARVQTCRYNYNAALPRVGNIFRYDSADEFHPEHHVHRFDTLAGDRDGTREPVDENEYPTLGEVIRELANWYYDHSAELRARGISD